ncbi:amidase domain-containing protein [Clostridium niameyense]|uniref:amidase domain-containing protein n=1 Tax=Clostridium niameyense TaxID=1622073 RepID=UPI00067F4498|nr:amidase domain-containing protein [Clostridium niameyense]
MKNTHKRLYFVIFIIFLFTITLFSKNLDNFSNETNKSINTTKQSKNLSNSNVTNNDSIDKEKIKEEIQNIYSKRCNAFVTLDLDSFSSYFDTSKKHGQWCLEHEVKRIQYLNDWAYKRDIKFTKVSSNIKIKKIYPNKNGKIRVILDEIYKFDYIYDKDENPKTNIFGIGVAHTVNLIKKGDKYVISTDWYTDCFEDALKAYSGSYKNLKKDLKNHKKYDLKIQPKDPNNVGYSSKYNRMGAVEYADKYCGVDWASGNNLKHNKKYKNFTGAGGDCTNFVSQVLGDEEAGGLPFDGSWYCTYNKYNGGEGSKAWVNADAFRNYIVYSGKGYLIKKGSFEKLIKATDKHPNGAIDKLDLGDLVCYAKGNDIDHFAVVTGWDSHGYPLINSHTTDRYHVPWDLGWGDKNIFFHLIHVR